MSNALHEFIHRPPDRDGAVDLDECHTRYWQNICHCDYCVVCGHAKHTAIHGPMYGQPPGSAPWGHRFRAKEDCRGH
jgi:hypothetical protein